MLQQNSKNSSFSPRPESQAMNVAETSIVEHTLASAALNIARSQVGQSEYPVGSNRGEMVNKYLSAVGLNPGYAWCQAFVYWCYEEAARQSCRENPMVKTAGVWDCWSRCTDVAKDQPLVAVRFLKEEVVGKSQVLQAGDQFIMIFRNHSGHTGIVERVAFTADGIPILHTIEGNSNADGSREGYAVVRRQRQLSDPTIKGFIRYV